MRRNKTKESMNRKINNKWYLLGKWTSNPWRSYEVNRQLSVDIITNHDSKLT